jgi:XTP/dITP diphosphohydrolase
MSRVVLASSNSGKRREFAHLLAPLGIEVVSQQDLAIEPCAEPHPSFIENALVKARHAAAASGLPALADDSGLCCMALNGAPGVCSARFAGEVGGDAANNAALVRALSPHHDRRAHFVCVLVALRSAEDPEPLVAQGRWEGHILTQPRGGGGFGYDPLFFVPELGRSAAELSVAEKNQHSHRARASRVMLHLIAEQWQL